MSTPADVVVEVRGPLVVARVAGEVDASNAGWIGGRLRVELTNRSETLVVDLSAVTYIDSAGIALVFALADDLRTHRQQLQVVVSEGSPIARMAALTGLSDAVPTRPSLEAVVVDEPSSSA
jgi:anti-anti-sigma factor